MRKNTFLAYCLLFVTLVSVTSCSKFSKLQKKGTDEEKYKAALEYYKKGDFYRSGLLFEELVPLLKGGTESELAQFYYAYSQYHQGQYNMSQFLFKKFYDTYARSEYAQEALYMHAFSMYKDSAPYTLDQASTLSAISALQDFINTYPESAFRSECSRYIIELRNKLELKAYEKTKLYYKISDFNLGSLKSAVISIGNFHRDFPDSQYNEELSYLRVDAQHKLAKSSLPDKQKERYEELTKYYQAFVDKYPESSKVRDAEKLYSDGVEKLEEIASVEKQRQEYLKKLREGTDGTKPTKVTVPTAQP